MNNIRRITINKNVELYNVFVFLEILLKIKLLGRTKEKIYDFG